MQKIDINCPDCGKLITKVSGDIKVRFDNPTEEPVLIEYGYCRRCKREKKIIYCRAK